MRVGGSGGRGSRWRARAAGALCLLVLAGGAGACGEGTSSAPTTTADGLPAAPTMPGRAAAEVDSVPLALLEAPGWDLVDGVEVGPDWILAGTEPVPTDWYGEYDQLEQLGDVTVQTRVTLSGKLVDIDTYRSTMET